MERISSLLRILSIRARSTLRIFPRSGRIAWKERSRPCLALPPAESPSTRKISLTPGGVSPQRVGPAHRSIVDGAVGQLARERRVLQPGLFADQVAGLPGRLRR